MTSNVSSYARQVGKRMRAARKAAGLSLQEVEARSGGQFTYGAISSYERADRRITMEKLTEYAAWLGVDVQDFLPPDKAPGTCTSVWRWQYAIADQTAAKAVREVADLCRVNPREAAALIATALTGPQDRAAASKGAAA